MVSAELFLFDWEDISDALYTLARQQLRDMKRGGRVDLFGGDFLYRLEEPTCSGAERWLRIRKYRKLPKPWLVECEEAATILWALLTLDGKEPYLRLLQFRNTVHVQVVLDGKVLDPSVKLGMKVPKKYLHKIYDLDFFGEN